MSYKTTITVTPIVTPSQFRSDFSEFKEEKTYTDSTVQYWLVVATLLLNARRWEELLQLGVELFVAHNIVLEAAAQQTALAGGWPGIAKGAITAEAAGKVSLSYDAVVASEESGGNYNLTVYGSRFLRLARLIGKGPLQVGPGGCGLGGTVPGANGGNVEWVGPNCRPGVFGS